MSDEVAPVGASVPEVDDILADALRAQGEAGVRALGLLRDARRVLTGTEFVRPEEVAAACVRSAADALLGLPGAPVTVGLKAAAEGLLAAVDAVAPTAAEVLGPDGPAIPVGDASPAAEASPPDAPAAGAGPAAADAAGGMSGVSAEANAAWERVTAAADVLRDELNRPGRYHQARARGIVERLMKVELGAAQETALDVWGTVYGVASGILHGRSAHAGEAAVLYADILAAARNLLVPLPDRAARVLELVALEHPGAADAKELAGWADPRAEAYFFRSGPATAWLTVLQEHAPHLLMPDGAAGGRWPAAPFLDHVATADPDAARTWLNAPADRGAPGVLRAQQIAATGRLALNALLGLAVRRWDVVDAAQLQAVLAGPGVRDGGGLEVAATLRLAARWARAVPRAERTGQWIGVVEGLLTGAVEDEHTGHLALDAVAERVRARMRAAGFLDGVAEDVEGAADEAAGADWVVAEEKMHELIALQGASRLPDHDVAMLVRELACTAYPAGRRGPAHRNVGAVRAVLAKLLSHDVELTAEESRPVVFHADLDQVRVGDAAAFGGPRLARAVLDVAAADADAGTGLAQRTRHFRRVEGLDARLHTRLIAAHLTRRPPSVGALDAPEWWQEALALVPQALAADPAPEPARLVELVLAVCPPEHAAQLEADVRTALGTPPPAALIEEVLPACADQADGRAEPLATWLRVWDWSPVLTSTVLQGWEPLLQALRRLEPAGPSDPRAQAVLEPVKTTTALQAEDLVELAAGQGPVAAALAAASDAGDDGYAMVLHRLVAAAPAAWTSDVPAVLAALRRPELAAFYLAAAAAHADRPGAFPSGALPTAVAAALEVRRGLGESAPTVGFDDVRRWPAGVIFADQALFDLLTAAWRADALAGDQERDAVAYLQALVAPLARAAGDTAPAAELKDGTAAATQAAAAPGTAEEGTTLVLTGSDTEVRALGCLLEYATHQARTTGEMPEKVLDTVAGVLAAHAGQEAVATAIGVHLPALHRYAPAFAAAHRAALYGLVPGRPSPAASWLRWSGPDGQLLAALGRAELLAALRAEVPGAAEHLAHALLDDPALLDHPAAWWTELADGTGDGVAAVSRLLEAIAARTPRTGADGPFPPAEHARVGAAVDLWRAALAADLPQGALVGAGAFADAAVEEMVWLELMRASAEHSPTLTDADLVAERAVAHPGRADALLLAAVLVTQAPGTWRETAVRRHARALLDAATALPQDERPCGVQELRTALINAGDVDAAARR
ncbi:hypothetical protein QFZ82_000315 [Streptomyces sp. V4I23]|uniref:hypothetical protein n=1 Tax=Streptomyces sp. V4I23 TaxID=3042282 RepID=UPI00278725B3|nr:hypothetical protein [Streptomyces sp. V4I23]MDQ1005830.1 hypothetical protein [Streptomyces sp. V4I23]